MKQYIGVKVINAKPMTRLEYNCFRGWDVPADENPDDEGFLVEYTDGGKANTKEFAGYVSWSPKEIFEKAYIATDDIPDSLTIEHIESVVTDAVYFTAKDAPLTICVLYLQNGFTVTGESACVNPENFNAQIGKDIARANAIEKVWMLEGYLLKQFRHEAGVN